MDQKKRMVFLGIWGATFVAMFGETIPQSFAPLFLAGLGITPAVIGLVYNIRNVEQTFLRLIAGSLSDLFGRKKLIVIGLLFITVVPFFYAVSYDAILPLIAMVISGIGMSIFFPPSEAYASSLYPPERVGEAMGRYHMSWAVSSIIGPSVGGFLALYFPDYRPLFVISGLIVGASLLVFWFFTKHDSEPKNREKMSGETIKLLRGSPTTIRRMLGNKRVFAGSVAVFAHAFCHWGIPTFMPLYASRLGFNEAEIGLALTANALIIALTLPIVGRISDRIGRFTPIIIGLSASVAVFWMIPSISSSWMLVLLMAGLGFCAVLEFPVAQAITMEALPQKDRGSATGVWGMMMSLGGTLGLFAMSYIVSVASMEWLFYFCAAVSLASAAVMFSIRSFFKA